MSEKARFTELLETAGADVINRISTEAESNIDELTPAGWKRAPELTGSENTPRRSAL